MYLQKVINRKTSKKNSFSVGILRFKIAGTGAGSGSIGQEFSDPDPDLYQNVMDPQH
jgi:hypothetical protein